MNNERRNKLREIIMQMQNIKHLITDVKNQEEYAYDNLPESLQYSDRGYNMEDNIDKIDDIIEQMEDIITEIDDMIN